MPKDLQGDRRGTEHIGPEDTFEGDYGRLLEQSYARLEGNRKGVASPRGLHPYTVAGGVPRKSV